MTLQSYVSERRIHISYFIERPICYESDGLASLPQNNISNSS